MNETPKNAHFQVGLRRGDLRSAVRRHPAGLVQPCRKRHRDWLIAHGAQPFHVESDFVEAQGGRLGRLLILQFDGVAVKGDLLKEHPPRRWARLGAIGVGGLCRRRVQQPEEVDLPILHFHRHHDGAAVLERAAGAVAFGLAPAAASGPATASASSLVLPSIRYTHVM